MAQRGNKAERLPPTFHLETLEQRILFSADSALMALDVLPQPDYVSHFVPMVVQLQNEELAATESVQAYEVEITELVIVDSSLSKAYKLLDDPEYSTGEHRQTVLLDAQTDGQTGRQVRRQMR